MIIITAILLLLAFVCFMLSTFGANVRINLTALGLAFWVFAELLTHWKL